MEKQHNVLLKNICSCFSPLHHSSSSIFRRPKQSTMIYPDQLSAVDHIFSSAQTQWSSVAPSKDNDSTMDRGGFSPTTTRSLFCSRPVNLCGSQVPFCSNTVGICFSVPRLHFHRGLITKKNKECIS